MVEGLDWATFPTADISGDEPKIGVSYVVDGKISNGEFVAKNEKWIKITLPEAILIPKIRIFTSGVSIKCILGP